MFSMS